MLKQPDGEGANKEEGWREMTEKEPMTEEGGRGQRSSGEGGRLGRNEREMLKAIVVFLPTLLGIKQTFSNGLQVRSDHS